MENEMTPRCGDRSAMKSFDIKTDVTIECPRCRAYKTVPRAPELPAEVRLIEIICPDCDDGDFHTETWFSAPGVEVSQDRQEREAASIKAAIGQLCELTKRWTAFEDIPRSQQIECRDIGRRLHAIGGDAAMRDAYYEATGHNRAATVIAAYFDGIGEWRW